MIKFTKILTVVVITSCFLFPFFFSFLPTINTKLFLTILGLVTFFIEHMRGETLMFEKGLWRLLAWTLILGFCSFLSMTINNTPDNSYVGYGISMMIWLFAAYFCVYLMKRVHGYVSVEIIGYYLMGVAVLQCSLAILISSFPFLDNLVNTYIKGDRYMGVGVGSRLHGIGCALDVAGGRLGTILIIITYLIILAIRNQCTRLKFICLLGTFIYVLIIGSMIGRTTSVGAALSFVYLVFTLTIDQKVRRNFSSSFLFSFVITISFCILISVTLYNINTDIGGFFRFGFEGFFNYFNHGTFETSSTNMLSKGMIFPDNLRTWIIGDGYMSSGMYDPYYLGPSDYGFYMNTDAGYSRFLFYFGLLGLSSFICFFICVCKECIQRSPKTGYLFLFMLTMNLLVWIKVTTDLFVIFAPFLCLPKLCENNTFED